MAQLYQACSCKTAQETSSYSMQVDICTRKNKTELVTGLRYSPHSTIGGIEQQLKVNQEKGELVTGMRYVHSIR